MIMDDILVTDCGRTISRVVTCMAPDGLAPLLEGYDAVYMVYDRQLEDLVARDVGEVLSSISGGRYRGSFAVTASEEDKNIDTVLGICRWLLGCNADRDALLLAVGGGITTDMAGFAASIYKRGMHFAYVPTTLLAQVDASVGGKTGVNLDCYKNMLGVISQPDFTFICPKVLDTLGYRDFLSGAAEMLKTFIIEDGGHYARAVEVLSGIYGSGRGMAAVQERRRELMELVHASVAVKARIVGEDQFDRGERMKLNLGHTFAHAIEHCARQDGADITHGEAVAIGIVLAAGLSEERGVCAPGMQERLRHDLVACGLPVVCPFAEERLAGAMAKDKKIASGRQNFVLIRDIGDVIVEVLEK